MAEAPRIPRDDIEELEEVVADLVARFDGVFPQVDVYQCVFEAYTALRRHATVHVHLVTLARRQALDRLTERAAQKAY